MAKKTETNAYDVPESQLRAEDAHIAADEQAIAELTCPICEENPIGWMEIRYGNGVCKDCREDGFVN